MRCRGVYSTVFSVTPRFLISLEGPFLFLFEDAAEGVGFSALPSVVEGVSATEATVAFAVATGFVSVVAEKDDADDDSIATVAGGDGGTEIGGTMGAAAD